MLSKILRTSLAAILAVALVLPPVPTASACGPWLTETIFTDVKSPEFDYAEYLSGRLGLLQPSYYDVFLFAAYRNLSGAPFTKDELAVLNPTVNTNPAVATSEGDRLGAAPNQTPESTLWHKAAGDPPLPRVEYADVQGVIRSESRDGNYIEYYNCLPDAFKTARERLERHRQQFGAESPAVLSWLEAQRKVFANCGQPYQFNKPPQEVVIPVASSESDPPIIRADRQYQIAAAYFYAGDYNAAANHFAGIAKNPDSPWRDVATYLQARSLIRRGTIGDAKGNLDKAALIAAENLLKQVVADPNQAKFKSAAQRRIDFLAARLRPEERRIELAAKLTRPAASQNFDQDKSDYFWLLDRQGYALGAKDDLTGWISAMKLNSPQATDDAVSQWQKTKSLPWLVAALCKVDPARPEVPSLLKAAASVPASSPAHATLLFHSFHLRALLSKDQAEITPDLDRVISTELAAMPVSAQNQFLALRMSLARTLDEFLRYAPRTPASVAYDFGDGSDVGLHDRIPPSKDGKAPEAQLDADSATIFNEKLSLSLLAAASKKDWLPVSIQRRLTLAAWTRAVVLKNDSIAQDLAPRLIALAPELKPALESYLSAQSADERGFTAVLALLRSPGLRPFVERGFGRETPPGELDSLHDNYWCSLQTAAPNAPPNIGRYVHSLWRALPSPLRQLHPDGHVPAVFFAAKDEENAAAEFTQLSELPPGPEWLGAKAIDYARTHPNDPRVAEALHLSVRATRYGCTGDGAGKISKTAFDLLHKNYPENEWTKKTPYWFR